MNEGQRTRLLNIVSQPVRWKCSLSDYTSFAIGGPAEALVTVAQQQELQELLCFLKAEDIPWRIIGKGTNLLVGDEGFAGVILLLAGDLAAVSQDEGESATVTVRAGGGAGLSRLAWHCSRHGLSGLEFACGIPGTTGGAVIMNAGAWGKDISQVVSGVTLMTADGLLKLDGGELDFSYRCWKNFIPLQGKAVVAIVDFMLRRSDAATAVSDCLAVQEKRKVSQPVRHRSAGSFFKNPHGDSAGRLIEACGLKGLQIGGAMVSEQHGNFLVNVGGASAADIIRLMKIVQDTVKRDTGILLEPEVHFL